MNKYIDKFKSLPAPAKATSVLMITTFIQKGFAFLTVPIFSRLLTPDELGTVSLFFSWYEIMAIICTLCLERGVYNNGMMDFKEDRDVFTFSMFALSSISCVVVATISILFVKNFYNFYTLPISLVIFMFVLILLEEAYLLWLVRQRFEYKYRVPAIITISLAILGIVFAVLSIFFSNNNKIYSRIFGERLIYGLIFVLIAIYISVKAHGKVKVSYWKYALKFNLPLIPHYLSLFILNHMDRIMISNIVGNAAVGVYTVSYTVSSVLRVFWTAINASLVPWTYEKCEKKKFKDININTMLILILYLFICVLFMLFAPEIMTLMAKSEYIEGTYIIPPIMAGVFFSSLYYIFANVVYYYKKPKYVMLASGIAAIVNLILNFIFINFFGYFAAAYTTLISYIVQTFINYWAMKKVVGFNFYNTRLLITISAIVIMFCFISLALYQNFILRYSVIIIFLLICCLLFYKNKERIKQIYKSFNKESDAT